jgi:hypothetical protein
MTDIAQTLFQGLLHPAPGSHLAAQGTALPCAVAPHKPEAKSEEDDE